MTHPPSASPALRPCHFVASRLRRARATGWGGRRPPQNGEFYARRSGSGGRQTLLPCYHQPALLTASGWCTFRVPDWYTLRMPPAMGKGFGAGHADYAIRVDGLRLSNKGKMD
jgi:hypothetical protein